MNERMRLIIPLKVHSSAIHENISGRLPIHQIMSNHTSSGSIETFDGVAKVATYLQNVNGPDC
jgi:hypothetical protein